VLVEIRSGRAIPPAGRAEVAGSRVSTRASNEARRILLMEGEWGSEIRPPGQIIARRSPTLPPLPRRVHTASTAKTRFRAALGEFEFEIYSTDAPTLIARTTVSLC